MNLKIKEVGHFGGGRLHVRLECNTAEQFLTMPSEIMVDGKLFKKICFRPECQFAGYEREYEVVAVSSDRAGTFEIIAGETDIVRATITVQN